MRFTIKKKKHETAFKAIYRVHMSLLNEVMVAARKKIMSFPNIWYVYIYIYNVHVCTRHIFPLNACVYTYSCTSGVSWVGLGRSIHMVGGIQPPRLSETAAGLNHWMFLSSYQCILILV